MKIYSYVIKSDSGFAPNPFWGYCTLATCKPVIRRIAKEGDWVIGTGSVENVGNDRLVYAMKVTEVMPLEDYWEDKRFEKKKPGKGTSRRVGDNIYYRDAKGIVKQYFPSRHSFSNRENPESKDRDSTGKNVLISKKGNFYYFGRKAPKIPDSHLYLIKKGPGHRCNFDQGTTKFLRWIQKKEPGVHGVPFDYPAKQENCVSKCKS